MLPGRLVVSELVAILGGLYTEALFRRGTPGDLDGRNDLGSSIRLANGSC